MQVVTRTLASAFGVALLLAVPAVALMGLGLGTAQAAQTPVAETALLPFNAPTSTLARLENKAEADPVGEAEMAKTLAGWQYTADVGRSTFNDTSTGLLIIILGGFLNDTAGAQIGDDIQIVSGIVDANGNAVTAVTELVVRVFKKGGVVTGVLTFTISFNPGQHIFIPPVSIASLFV